MRAERPKRKPQPPVPLPIGARLGAFDVRSVLGQGQYGFVYRVYDPETEAEYAVKEYLPPMLAVRDGERVVAPRTPDDAESFALGLRFFVREGKLLSQLRHPSLVHVYGAWEENGTAYMAMDLVAGRNLRDTLLARWKSPRETTLRAMLDSLLGAIEVLHRAGLQHRDIAPQSIVIDPAGRPLLMDLGTPRRLAAARGETGPAGPRDGYAAIEMYGHAGGHKRGPWTDFYALGATLHYMITGKPPAPAPEREGTAAALHWGQSALLRHSLDFLAVVEWMLSPRPQDRPQSVAAVRAALAGHGLPERLRPRLGARLAVQLRRHRGWLWLGAGLLLVAVVAVSGHLLMTSELLPWRRPRG
jgi:serine/threonine protein kinase